MTIKSIPTTPLIAPRRIELPAFVSGIALRIVGLLFLVMVADRIGSVVLTHAGAVTEAQAVAWALVVAGVITALHRWA